MIEKDIRKKLIEVDVLDTVISIGKNLFFNSPMEACILICRTNKPDSRKGNVLLIKASDLVERKNTESYLTPDHINTIVSLYNQYENIEGRSCVIKYSDIPEKNYTISPKYFVKSTTSDENEDIQILLQNWNKASDDLHKSVSTFIDHIV